MKNYYTKIEFGKTYHIFNRGINGTDLFSNNDNYEYFLKLYEKHIHPVADTYAWALMKNHFHFLVRIKTLQEIEKSSIPKKPLNDENRAENKTKKPHQYFSNLFNAYTQAYNKMNHRHGSLFERPFKRLFIANQKYFQNTVVYIHQNPVHHFITEHILDYPWTSYQTLISMKPSKLCRNKVLGYFDSLGNFKAAHDQDIDEDILKEISLD